MAILSDEECMLLYNIRRGWIPPGTRFEEFKREGWTDKSNPPEKEFFLQTKIKNLRETLRGIRRSDSADVLLFSNRKEAGVSGRNLF